MPRLVALACTAGIVGSLLLPASPAAAATTTVSVGDSAFAPGDVTVGVGDAVTWHFTSSAAHSITADDGSFDSHPACAGTAETCGSAGDPDFTATFSSAGTFAYYCRVHGGPGGVGMSGRVVVAAPDTTPPAAVTGLVAKPADSQVTLRWANPADADFAGVDVRMAPGTTPPAAHTDGTSVYSGAGTSVTKTGLANGTAYSFAVFARDGAGNRATPVSTTSTPVPALVTTLTLAITPGTVIYGGTVTLAGTLRRADTSAALGGRPVEIWARPAGRTSWVRINRVTSGSDGSVVYRTRPGSTSTYIFRHVGDPFYAGTDSPGRTVSVRQALRASASRLVMESGQSVTLAGTVYPAHAGQALYLQQYVSGAWRTIQRVALSSTGTGRFTFGPRALGTYLVRVARPGDYDHLASNGPTMRLTVVRRTLRPGMSGADVLAVQRRLAELRYDVGAQNGYYGYDTTHAVQAFQKVQGLPRTTVVDSGTWSRLFGRPVRPVLRWSRAGRWVEADLTKQVLYLGRDHALERIVDISSGSGQLYTVEGETHRAVTPTGQFSILWKINAWRTSRLGQLYRPAYFHSGGYAIHGSYSVPSYPASHGCIRVTIPAMDRLYSLLGHGTPVWVYRS